MTGNGRHTTYKNGDLGDGLLLFYLYYDFWRKGKGRFHKWLGTCATRKCTCLGTINGSMWTPEKLGKSEPFFPILRQVGLKAVPANIELAFWAPITTKKSLELLCKSVVISIRHHDMKTVMNKSKRSLKLNSPNHNRIYKLNHQTSPKFLVILSHIIHTHIYIYVYIYMYIYICIYVYVYIYIHMYTYLHICTNYGHYHYIMTYIYDYIIYHPRN